MQKVGLVLAGGGGKGAYHIGVWKALNEYGVSDNISAVSGTSVGALNASLFSQGDYRIAETIWSNIQPSQILSLDVTRYEKNIISSIYLGSLTAPLLKLIKKVSKIGVFSRSGMLEIIEQYININYISNSTIPCYATCCEFGSLKETYFPLKGESEKNIISILLATSALPIVFKPEKINGDYYVDGGLKDNIPIEPLYKEGYRNIIVVHCNPDEILSYDPYPDANIIEIVPSQSIGEFVDGTLDFTRKGSLYRMKQGYEDAIRILQPIYEMGKLNQHRQESISKCIKDEHTFQEKRNETMKKRQALHNEIDQLL
ncbi:MULTISPECIES: patatin-like phospholipase family protein [Bacillus cereus group]|uniref:patatin-like phospholipase family protein n=1 Tax=Bacillus cereus group TaxID=86661 RepID=UPI0024BD4989|nr:MULTISPECIES: patatin-like phospholipase family protein [Bacillus cereus group]MED3396734.1 patatin-like phospholipase family protein [Bacillus wiedmannii]